MYNIKISNDALKFLSSLKKDDSERIMQRINQLAQNPRNDHVIKLVNKKPTQYRARQGDYRIFFTIHDEELLVRVIDVKKRKDSYR